ncbi:putative PR domain zinc finger protein 15 [Apostichopus japonicus]|uniref:Putative PR domain zinc finger protein 15 n=1 Tax=Stichopus japonicus TaxID=307972 RepID=A0A2G8K6D5_STIJA|nr:putative PR domain zinc finger protein 15 [Apostichopus japonicus]
MVTKTVTMDFEDDVEDLWCEDCQHNHGLDCPKLGPAIRVEDRKVQTKAVATLPDNLSIRMIGGSRQVIASQPIARRTQFGPLEAKIVHEESVNVAVKYKVAYRL